LLRVVDDEGGPVIRGRFQIREQDEYVDAYDVEIKFPKTYTHYCLPIVFEVGGRIPRSPERHIHSNGAACTCVPEEWLARGGEASFAAFMAGPARHFFLSQSYFEVHGKFPFGEREHGLRGVLAAYGEVLGVGCNPRRVLRLTRILAAKFVRRRWICECGSRRRIRDCCQARIFELRGKVSRKLAERMLARLKASGGLLPDERLSSPVGR
jgi:hypothetical protein